MGWKLYEMVLQSSDLATLQEVAKDVVKHLSLEYWSEIWEWCEHADGESSCWQVRIRERNI